MREATIQVIEKVEHIENSDFLDKVKVLGWSVVCKRDEYKVGDYCVFVTIDSLLPDKPEFEFMRKNKFRVRSVKLRGELSQGIVFPLDILNIDAIRILGDSMEKEGCDVSEALGITHYEKPVPVTMGGLVRGSFPSHIISKTDEERIQNVPAIIDELKDLLVCATLKMDGTSATYLNFNGDYHICSRNNSMKIDNQNVYTAMFNKYNLMNKLQGRNLAIQGEICGPGIQGNRMGLKELELFVFNIFDLDDRKYLNYNDFVNMVEELGLQSVPVIDTFVFNHTMDGLLQMATELYYPNGNRAEGMVIRPVVERHSNVLHGRTSVKIVNDLYLLENKE